MKKAHWILILAGFLVAAAGFTPLRALEVREAGGAGRIVFLKRIVPGETFTLSFIHSVEKSEVMDCFRIDADGRIILYQTEFSSLNAGLPAVVSGQEVLSRTGGGFRLSNFERAFPEILLWVHEDYGGTLSVGGRAVSLPAVAGNGLLRITTRSACLWELVYQEALRV